MGTPTTLLALCLLAAPSLSRTQDPAAGERETSSWRLLNRVEIVVNTDCLTLRTLDEKINRDDRMVSVDTQEAYDALRLRIALESVNDLLKRQAGEDLGYDEELVKARADEIWEERVAEEGGITEARRLLDEDSKSVIEKREEIQSELYASSWQYSVLGRDAGPGGRPVYDRYTRPGQLRQRYERMRETGLEVVEALGAAGAVPASYELQVLLLDPRQLGGGEVARRKGEELRAALERDEIDWEEALLTFGAMQENTRQVNRTLLMRAFDPGSGALVTFVDEADLESYSPLLPFAPMDDRGRRELRGFAIYKLLERSEATIPGFEEQGVQKALRRYMQSRQDEERYESGLQELRNKAYVWYPGIEAERARAEASAEARKREALETREEREDREEAEGGGAEGAPGAAEPAEGSEGPAADGELDVRG